MCFVCNWWENYQLRTLWIILCTVPDTFEKSFQHFSILFSGNQTKCLNLFAKTLICGIFIFFLFFFLVIILLNKTQNVNPLKIKEEEELILKHDNNTSAGISNDVRRTTFMLESTSCTIKSAYLHGPHHWLNRKKKKRGEREKEERAWQLRPLFEDGAKTREGRNITVDANVWLF